MIKVTGALLIGTSAAPACLPASAADDPALQTFLQGCLKEGHATEDKTTRYSVAAVSLDDKTQMDLVHISGCSWCGSRGCTALRVGEDQSSFKVIQKFTLARPPIRVLPSLTNGRHDIAMGARGGGASGRVAMLRYNGSRYPGNPSTAPALQAKDLPNGDDLPLAAMGPVLYP